ncbi:MAG: GIY-YIG nuclease family protein [Cyanobacteriota bacterium]
MILTQEVLDRYRANQGYVYLIHAIGTDRYKIGRSINPPVRLETLKKQSPYPLQIVECFWTPDAIADELTIHKRWQHLRQYGEWFEFANITPEQEELFRNNEATMELWDLRCNSSSYVAFESFHVERPTFRAISQLYAKIIIEQVKKQNDLIIADILEHIEYFFEEKIYLAVFRCDSLDKVLSLCHFVANNWLKCVLFSTRGLEWLNYTELSLVFEGAITGFASSLHTSGGEQSK